MYSSIAYQGAKGIDKEYIYNLHKDFILEADLVFILHLNIETALNRIMEKRGFVDRFENKHYLEEVDKIFHSFNASYIHHIDASKDQKSICDEILNTIKDSKILPLDSLQ